MSGFIESAKNFVAEKIANIKYPEAELKDVDLDDVNRDHVVLKGKVSVNNPYNHSIPICDISFVLKSVDREIASGTIPDPGSLAVGLTQLDVPVKVPYGILFSLAKDIGADWDIDYVMEIGLIIDLPVVGNVTLPLSQKGEFKLPTFSDFFK
ncbi:Late embryogenesis abundant protein Lea14-A [Ranunculus cassubicifolius]